MEVPPKLKLDFQPANEKQDAFLYSQKKAILLSGAVGAGKSYLGCVKGFMLNIKYPGNRGLICRKENRTLHNSTMLTLLEQVIPKNMIVSFSIIRGELVHKTLDPERNSTMVFSGLDKGADQQYPTKIASTEYGWIFPDEGVECDKGDWDMLTTRLRYKPIGMSLEDSNNMVRQIFTCTNPDAPSHWLYKFFIGISAEERLRLSREVIYVTPYDNPYLSEDYLQTLEHNLSGVNRQRLLEGKWVRAEGVIYPEFDPLRHVDDKDFLPLKDYKQLIIGADANYPLPRAWLLLGIRGDGNIDVLREFYKESSYVEEAIQWALSIKNECGRDVSGYHDPSDPVAIDKANREGIMLMKANNKILPGISEVARHFMLDKIKINPSCTNLIRSLQTYRWKKGREDKKDIPEKEEDHLPDALRYGLYSFVEGAGSIGMFFDESGFL